MESWHWENITVRNQVYDQTLPDYAIGSAGEPIDGKTEPEPTPSPSAVATPGTGGYR